MKTLAVIIPRFANSQAVSDITQKTIESVLEHQDYRFKTTVTVVDDGSVYHPVLDARWTTFQRGTNKGIAVRWNEGWKENASADFLCWLNADCVVTKGWSYPLVVAAEQLGCISMPYTNGEKTDGHGITGWCFLTTQQVAETIGPFDETFVPCRYEDVEWFHRAIYDHKIPLVNVPTSNVLHTRMEGGTKDVPRFGYLHMANRFRYAWKHNVDPDKPPPFWKPLPEVDIEENS